MAHVIVFLTLYLNVKVMGHKLTIAQHVVRYRTMSVRHSSRREKCLERCGLGPILVTLESSCGSPVSF